MNQVLQLYIKEHKKEDCCEELNTSQIVLKDISSGSASFRIENKDKQTIIKIQVDSCLITTEKIKRCDWIIYKKPSKIPLTRKQKGMKTLKKNGLAFKAYKENQIEDLWLNN